MRASAANPSASVVPEPCTRLTHLHQLGHTTALSPQLRLCETLHHPFLSFLSGPCVAAPTKKKPSTKRVPRPQPLARPSHSPPIAIIRAARRRPLPLPSVARARLSFSPFDARCVRKPQTSTHNGFPATPGLAIRTAARLPTVRRQSAASACSSHPRGYAPAATVYRPQQLLRLLDSRRHSRL